MYVEKIHIDEYKVFKDFDIDFLDSDNKPLDLVVLAGINGSGKTSLFEFIHNKLSQLINEIKGNLDLNADDFIFNSISLGSNKITKVMDILNNKYQIKNMSKSHNLFKEKIIYIKAQEQKTQDIKKEIVSYIDSQIFEEELSAKDAYKNLREKIDAIFTDLEMQVKFSSLDRSKNIFFENSFGEKISIDDLSTGEKELLSKVFFLYISDFKNSIIMIDEPEISLHPSWQNRIVKLYKSFAKQNNNQIIIATHSPQIVASTPKESLRILAKENNAIKAYAPDAYGMEFSKALTDIMGVTELRDIDVQKQYDRVKELIKIGKYKDDSFKDELSTLENMMPEGDIDLGLLKLELLKKEKQDASSN